MMSEQPNPVDSINDIVGVSSPYYVVGEYPSTWNGMEVRLWIWKGAYDSAFTSEPNYTLSKNKLNIDDQKVEINIADYIFDTINPTFVPFNPEENKSDNSFFYYEIDIKNNDTVVHTETSKLKIGTLGWRYDYQMIDLLQSNASGAFPDGVVDSDFGFYNLPSKEKYFKYSTKMLGSIWFTNRSLPIENITTSKVYYDDLDTLLTPDQEVCSPYNYGLAFINKGGDWDLIPMFGKVLIRADKSATKYNRGFRYKTDFSDRYQNSVREVNEDDSITYIVNTGKVSEIISKYLETILYSPMLYIVDYDNLIAYPVKLESTTFERKNITNNRSNIQHTFTFKGDNPKKLKY